MSWFRNLIGDLDGVGAAIVKEAELLEKDAYNAVGAAVAKAESGIVDAVRLAFEGAMTASAKELGDLGLHVKSEGHFNAVGIGQMTLEITSSIVPAASPAPEADVPPPQAAPPTAAPPTP